MKFEAITDRSYNRPSKELINVFQQDYANDESLATNYKIPDIILIGSVAAFTGLSNKYNKIVSCVA